MRGERGGLRTTVEFMNIWGAALKSIPHALHISYEAMHAAPEETLARVLRFFGEAEPDPRALRAAIGRARFDRLQSLERTGAFASGRLTAGDAADTDSYKVRRGKVGGFKDYFDDGQRQALDAIVHEHLSADAASLAGPAT
jgi:hypothetical protein